MVRRSAMAALGLLLGCVGSPDPVSETDARINETIERAGSDGFPDVRDVPGEGPEIPSAREIAAAEAALLAQGRALLETVELIRAEEKAVAEGRDAEAAALRRQIEADRAAAAAEPPLSAQDLP